MSSSEAAEAEYGGTEFGRRGAVAEQGLPQLLTGYYAATVGGLVSETRGGFRCRAKWWRWAAADGSGGFVRPEGGTGASGGGQLEGKRSENEMRDGEARV